MTTRLLPRTAPAAVALPRVRFYLASRGNYFMAELAGLFAEGFDRLGARASLEFDAVPPREPADDELSIVVAPHEFFPLFLVPKLRTQWPATAAACWCLATEQPGSRCFEAAFRFAARCRGVFDINGLGVREFRRRGVPAEYVPLGYASSAEAPETVDGRRDIDVLFLGHHSTKRARFFARHAPRLAAWNCHLVLNDVHEPRRAGTPGFVSGHARNLLLRRARILLNLHSAQRHYFEWQRALYAMANGCLVVSETSQGAEPLVNGQHLVFADEDQLMDRCEEYLHDEPKRRALADQAYRFLREEFTIEQGCRRILETHGRPGGPTPGPNGARPGRGSWRRDTAALVRAAYFQAKTLPSSLGPRLRRCRLAHTLYYPTKSLLDRLRGRWSLAEIERRRRQIVERLDVAEADRHGGVRSDYELLPNGRYRAAVAPAVSVVVTVYNYARFVGACLESVARSHVEGLPGPFETVIVDDASTDHSAEVADQWLRREAGAGCLVRKATNTGLADARNLGLVLARAPLVFILDADNLVYPRCLAKLARTMRQSGAAAAYGMIRRFDDRTGQGIDLVSWHAWDPARLVAAPYLDAMAMFDRQALLDLGGYSTELVRYGWFGWEDYDLWLKLAQAGYDGAFCPEVVAEYRVHGASMVHITSHYKPRLVRYFREKFADLAARYPDGPRRFGWAQ